MKHHSDMEPVSLNTVAFEIIEKAIKRSRSRREVAAFYGIPPDVVEEYLTGGECGALNARKVIRVEIARQRALIERVDNFVPGDKDRYKGTRNI